jgi:hypothetical protein
MQELEVSQISRDEAALRMAKRLAKEIFENGDDPLLHLRDFESLWIRAGYPHEISDLGTLYEDVWIAQSAGQSDVRDPGSVISMLRNFVQPLDAA